MSADRLRLGGHPMTHPLGAPAAASPAPAGPAEAATSAADTLARVQGSKVATVRALLVRLLQAVAVAEGRLGQQGLAGGQQFSPDLLAANQALLVAALLAQADAEDSARHLAAASQSAELDSLTRLPNRAQLKNQLSRAIAQAQRHGSRLAVLFLDIDNFKPINDTLGHGAGDMVLQRVARCLLGAVREADTVSRYGGDEFVILLDNVTQPADVVRVAATITTALDAPALVRDQVLRLSVSIGISLYPDDGDDAEALILLADDAMYAAKRRGPGSYAFHGQLPGAAQTLPCGRPLTLAEQERRNSELREANSQLVRAAIGAQALQAAAELAQRQQASFMAAVLAELADPHAPIRVAAAMVGRATAADPLLPRVQQLAASQARQIDHLLDAVADSRGNTAEASTAALLDLQDIDLTETLDRAAKAWQPVLQARHIRFALQRPGAALPVRGDPARLLQVLNNLLDNAAKFTLDGGQIGLGAVLAGDQVRITVDDNGVGISTDALALLFEPFAQAGLTLGLHSVGAVAQGGGQVVGPGIGLTVVRTLVQAHGGSVAAFSAGIGQGSRFTVTLPFRATTAAN